MSIKSYQPELPVLTIVGRPNVGKSSLFNAVLRRRAAIVHEMEGVTRDRVALPARHNERWFQFVDTGGLALLMKQKKGDFMDQQIRKQLEDALEGTDAIIMLCDVHDSENALDREIAKLLHKSGKPVVLAVNKCDNPDMEERALENFAKLGIGEPVAISCQHKTNIMALMDIIVPQLRDTGADDLIPELKITLTGRPNVGKSSIVNRMLGEDRVIISDIAGTTRDAVDIPFTCEIDGEEEKGFLIDTAGIKKQGALVNNLVEHFAMERSEKAIERASTVLFVLDVAGGVTTHDKKIANLIKKHGKPCILIANKWDLAKGEKPMEEFTESVRRDLPHLSWCPLIFTSATHGTGFGRIMPAVAEVRNQSLVKAPTGILNQVLQDMVDRNPPPSTGRGFFKIYYGTMIQGPPAKFLIFCNRKNYLQRSYIAFIEKTLRNAFGLEGVPVEIDLRERTHVQDKFREGSSDPGKSMKRKLAGKRRQNRQRNSKYRK